MGNTESFEYSPLQGDEIRLVRFSVSSSSERIRCEVAHFSFCACPAYTALSYTWGNSFWIRIIELNGREFTIRSNLHGFLEEAQERLGKGTWSGPEGDTDCRPWMWIDAICINQSDIQERNAQVLRMKNIYEMAENIVCWLGSMFIFRDGHTAIKMLDYLADLDKEYPKYGPPEGKLINRMLGPDDTRFTDLEWDYLRALLHCPWWTRAWIVQEASTPKMPGKKMVWFGPYARMFGHFVRANRVLLLESSNPAISKQPGRTYNSSISLLNVMVSERHIENEKKGLSLLDALPNMKIYDATDPRDKVYALLSICMDGQHHDLAPDYGLSVEEVFTNLSAHILLRDMCLDLLGNCHYSKRNARLATWVPDWAAELVPLAFSKHGRSTSYRAYNADLAVPAVINIIKSTGTLQVRGIVFDAIQTVGRVRHDDPAQGRDIEVYKNWRLLTMHLNPEYVSGGTRWEALQHTLCADIKESSEWTGDDERGGTVLLPEMVNGEYPEDIFFRSMTLHRRTVRRRLMVTTKGYLGLAPPETKTGDLICILYGGQLPFVLRGAGTRFELIGEVYVHGIMGGEATRTGEAKIREQDFDIQ
jgi:Heterokaryon incompatibility protein (HET)